MAPEWLGRRLTWAVAALAASALFMAWWLHWFDLVDLEVYRAGATAFLHGRDIYTARPRMIPLPFTYPPFAAIFFVPLGLLPDIAARVAMSLVSEGALVFASLAALRLAAPRWAARSRWTVALAIAAATPLVEPIRDTFRLGQVNLVLMALVLADLAAIGAGDRRDEPQAGHARRVPRGVLLGVATAVKLTPGIFILYLVAIRRSREAVTAIVSAAAATVVAAVLMPSESAHFWRHLVLDDRRIGSAGSVWNQSLRGAVARLSGSPDRAHLLWLGLALVTVVAGLALAARLHTGGPGAGGGAGAGAGGGGGGGGGPGAGGGQPLLGLGVAALTGLLVSPISWNHHWVWFLPLAIALVARAAVSGRRIDRWVAGVWGATFCLASISWWPFAGQDDYRLGALNTVAADCYVLAALLVLGLIAWDELGPLNLWCVHPPNSAGQAISGPGPSRRKGLAPRLSGGPGPPRRSR